MCHTDNVQENDRDDNQNIWTRGDWPFRLPMCTPGNQTSPIMPYFVDLSNCHSLFKNSSTSHKKCSFSIYFHVALKMRTVKLTCTLYVLDSFNMYNFISLVISDKKRNMMLCKKRNISLSRDWAITWWLYF